MELTSEKFLPWLAKGDVGFCCEFLFGNVRLFGRNVGLFFRHVVLFCENVVCGSVLLWEFRALLCKHMARLYVKEGFFVQIWGPFEGNMKLFGIDTGGFANI